MAIDSESFAMLKDGLDRFVSERLIPREKEIDALDRPPAGLLAEVRGMGLFGLAYPETYGGLGASVEQQSEIGFILGRTTPAMRNYLSIHNGVAGQAIICGATDEQKARLLPRLATGDLIGAFALTEPDSGSDARSISTKAEPVDGGWLINGAKRFISNATFADLFVVMTKTPLPNSECSDAISAFLIPSGATGMSIGKPEEKMGQHGSPICDVNFDDCLVAHDALLGGVPGRGFEIAKTGLDRGRLFISSCCVGLAYRVVEDAADFALERKQFGRSISQYQLIQALLADSLTEAYAAEGMVRQASKALDAGRDVSREASMCKMFCTEMVGRVADRCLQAYGGAGYIADYMIEQIYRDVRVLRIYEGTTQIQQISIARDLFKRREARERLSAR